MSLVKARSVLAPGCRNSTFVQEGGKLGLIFKLSLQEACPELLQSRNMWENNGPVIDCLPAGIRLQSCVILSDSNPSLQYQPRTNDKFTSLEDWVKSVRHFCQTPSLHQGQTRQQYSCENKETKNCEGDCCVTYSI